MWWFLTLLILALVAFFVVKSMKSGGLNQTQQHDNPEQSNSALPENPPQSEPASADSLTTMSAGIDAASAGETDQPVGVSAAGNTSMKATATGLAGLQTGDTLSDVREMIKILNLDRPDAGRLDISAEELIALRKGNNDGAPEGTKLEDVAARLRKMLA